VVEVMVMVFVVVTVSLSHEGTLVMIEVWSCSIYSEESCWWS